MREEKFLTYEAFSLYDEFKGYLMISSSCLPGNSVLVKDLIQEEISQISKGQFSHMEFAEALDQLETYYQTCEDDHHRWVDFYLRQILSNKEMNVPEFIERLKSVDIIQVVEAASSLRMDTLYILKAEK